MSISRYAVLALLACAALLSIAGCGSSSDDSSSTQAADTVAASEGSTVEAGGSTGVAGGPGSRSESAQGSGGNGGGSAGPGSTPASFQDEAKRVCQQVKQQIRNEAQPIFEQNVAFDDRGPLVDQLVNDVIIANLEREIEELEALEPPAGFQAGVEQMVASMEAIFERARNDPIAFVDEGPAFQESESIAKRNGLPQCGGTV